MIIVLIIISTFKTQNIYKEWSCQNKLTSLRKKRNNCVKYNFLNIQFCGIIINLNCWIGNFAFRINIHEIFPLSKRVPCVAFTYLNCFCDIVCFLTLLSNHPRRQFWFVILINEMQVCWNVISCLSFLLLKAILVMC